MCYEVAGTQKVEGTSAMAIPSKEVPVRKLGFGDVDRWNCECYFLYYEQKGQINIALMAMIMSAFLKKSCEILFIDLAALSESGDLYVWGWNETGQLGFPYKSESSYPLFHFFEHSCTCPKSSLCKHGHSQKESSQSHDMASESKDKGEEGKSGEQKENTKAELDERINPERCQEVVNVEASPRLLDFWREDVNIRDVQCGDRHTLFMLGKLPHMISSAICYL